VPHVIPFPTLAAVANDSLLPSSPVPLHDAVASSRRRHRSLIAAAGQWALGRGISLPADHVALWAEVADESGFPGSVDEITGPWHVSAMPDLLTTIAAWCDVARCHPPADLAQSLWHLYGFLANTNRLHPASDALTELRAALVVFAAYDRVRPGSPLPPAPQAA
jgi:hypothetical protein